MRSVPRKKPVKGRVTSKKTARGASAVRVSLPHPDSWEGALERLGRALHDVWRLAEIVDDVDELAQSDRNAIYVMEIAHAHLAGEYRNDKAIAKMFDLALGGRFGNARGVLARELLTLIGNVANDMRGPALTVADRRAGVVAVEWENAPQYLAAAIERRWRDCKPVPIDELRAKLKSYGGRVFSSRGRPKNGMREETQVSIAQWLAEIGCVALDPDAIALAGRPLQKKK